MPDKPTLMDYFRCRFASTNHLLQSAALAIARRLIDAGYRGEVKVILLNTDRQERFVVEPGMRIAQLVVLEVPQVELVEVAELPSSERGARGFGSSRH